MIAAPDESIEDGGMLTVGWDTCTRRVTLALASCGEVILETYFEAVKGHTGWLLPVLDEAVKRAGEAGGVRAVAAGIGPGAFTGVKVGVTAAKVVAAELGVPLYAVSTLDLLAADTDLDEGGVVASIDAGRNAVYAAAYRLKEGSPVRVTERVIAEEGNFAAIVGEAGKPAEVVGFIPSWIERASKAEGFALREALPEARYLVSGGSGRLTGAPRDPLSVTPIYLKNPV